MRSSSWLYHTICILDIQLHSPSQVNEACTPQQLPVHLIILLYSYTVNGSKGCFKKQSTAEDTKTFHRRETISFILGAKKKKGINVTSELQ